MLRLCTVICRQEQYEKSAAGRAARAQLVGAAKQSANPNKGKPVLQVLVFKVPFDMLLLKDHHDIKI